MYQPVNLNMIANYRRNWTKPFFLLAILMAVAAGCAHQPIPPEAVLFSIDGKISVRNGQQGRSGRFAFKEYAQFLELEVWGPLGQGRTQLSGNEDSLTLTQGDKVLAQGDAESLMREQLGWYVPLAVFSAWLQGTPHADYPLAGVETTQQAQRFLQAGWQVELSRFVEAGNVRRPGRISAVKGELRVLLITRA